MKHMKKYVHCIVLICASVWGICPAYASISGHGGVVTPGITISEKTGHGWVICTSGFLASRGSMHYLFTAGHCVHNPHATVYALLDNKRVPVGRYVAYDPRLAHDIALVELFPQIKVNGRVPGVSRMVGVERNFASMKPLHPTVCKMGQTSGGSCGKLHETNVTNTASFLPSKPGDSGAPMYYFHPHQGWKALGILVRKVSSVPEKTISQEIYRYMDRFHLQLMT